MKCFVHHAIRLLLSPQQLDKKWHLASIGIHQEYWFHQNSSGSRWLIWRFFFLSKRGPKFNGPPSGDGFVFAASDKRFCICRETRERASESRTSRQGIDDSTLWRITFLKNSWCISAYIVIIIPGVQTGLKNILIFWKEQTSFEKDPEFFYSSAFLTLIRANNISAILPEKWHQYAFAFLLQQNWWPLSLLALFCFFEKFMSFFSCFFPLVKDEWWFPCSIFLAWL